MKRFIIFALDQNENTVRLGSYSDDMAAYIECDRFRDRRDDSGRGRLYLEVWIEREQAAATAAA